MRAAVVDAIRVPTSGALNAPIFITFVRPPARRTFLTPVSFFALETKLASLARRAARRTRASSEHAGLTFELACCVLKKAFWATQANAKSIFDRVIFAEITFCALREGALDSIGR